ncbi:MAG: class I SAM-dependent methyltransferase [Deferribacteraceae bacterium]|jgi:SAM-dependent methyltransferase|nr:class I SAM-dependent methyltransferase [Deferribacteraceae bacterium]
MSYAKFAKYYDRYWTKDAPALFEMALNRLVLPLLPEKADILDLCCGTGQLSARLSHRRFNVIGVDNSREMLDIAEKNAPDVLFSLQDAETFSLSQKFSAVVSVFDSVNHFLSEESLLNLFNSVMKALKDGGIFFFDINGINAFDDDWDEGFSMVDCSSACIVKPLFEPVTGDIVYNIIIFEVKGSGGDYLRTDTQVQERFYPNELILSLLRESGFNEVQIVDGYADLKIKAFKCRQFFLAKAN